MNTVLAEPFLTRFQGAKLIKQSYSIIGLDLLHCTALWQIQGSKKILAMAESWLQERSFAVVRKSQVGYETLMWFENSDSIPLHELLHHTKPDALIDS